MVSSTRVAALLLVSALLLAACGSQLSEEQRARYSAAQQGGQVAGSVTRDDGSGAQVPVDRGTQGPSAAATATPGAAGGGQSARGQSGGGQSGGGQSGGGPSDGGQPGAGGSGGGQPGGGSGGGQQPTDTRAAPPGGNGGATDVGVTGDTITVYNVADLTGAVPGLFQDAKEATQAYFAYFAATEGTVYGREIEFVSRDTGLSANGNRSAYLDACESAFAAVGSMSAFEEGAADPIRNCSPTFPDLRNIRTSEPLQRTNNSFGTDALSVGQVPLSEWTYYKEQFPDAITEAGYVFLENTTTQFQTGQNRSATSRIGYNWTTTVPVATSETNYARVVNELESNGVQFVAFQGAYQQAARLVEAMNQQGYQPAALALQTNVYTPDLLQLCAGGCDEFVSLAVTGALVEEIGSNPEMQTYAEWLARINPNARPTGLGLYSWGAARLFVQALKEIGPEPTRARLIEYLQGVDGYTANGLFPPQDIGSQTATDCIIMVDIEDNQFVRAESGDGYRCRDQGPGSA